LRLNAVAKTSSREVTAMQVFISWSGERSKRIAEEWMKLIRPVIQSVEVFFSPEDIASGSRQWNKLGDALAKSNVGILCVTPENKEKPWLLFEAGALSKIPNARVCTFLHGLTAADLKDSPLGQFQHEIAGERGARSILRAINNQLRDEVGSFPLADDTLNRLFTKFWPEFRKTLKDLPVKAPRASRKKTKARSEADMLKQILDLLQQRQASTNTSLVTSEESAMVRQFRSVIFHIRRVREKYKETRENTMIRMVNRDLRQFVATWDRSVPEPIRLRILTMMRACDEFPESAAAGKADQVLLGLHNEGVRLAEMMSRS
jgi:hypothetical protein